MQTCYFAFVQDFQRSYATNLQEGGYIHIRFQMDQIFFFFKVCHQVYN